MCSSDLGKLGRTGGEIEDAHGVIIAAYARSGNLIPLGDDDAPHPRGPGDLSAVPLGLLRSSTVIDVEA